MAVLAFATNTETGLDAMQGDMLALTATMDDTDLLKEDTQLMTWVWALVKALRARQREAGTIVRDRLFGLYIGGHTERALLPLFTMIEPVYQEFLVAFNAVDDVADDPWGVNTLTVGTGPFGGPVH